MSTLQATNLKHGSSASNNLVLDANGNVTAAGTVAMATPYAMRNKIINGAMEIDQRNAGASVTANDSVFAVDRFRFSMTASSKGTGQRSTVAPSGFINSLLFTSSAATSVGASDQYAIVHPIEGVNIADLSWGSASAKTVTLSFWVRSSLTGTFGGALQNSAANRSYPFSYSVSSANTWEQKTITIPGDTTGTWLTDTGMGIRMFFSLGMGSTFSGTAGSWAASNLQSATGATSVVSTNGATFYLTGVQLEVGSVATPFERRNFQQELAMCQRYLRVFNSFSGSAYTEFLVGAVDSSTLSKYIINLDNEMRSGPTLAASGNFGNTAGGAQRSCVVSIGAATASRIVLWGTASGGGQTVGHASVLQGLNDATARLLFSAEL